MKSVVLKNKNINSNINNYLNLKYNKSLLRFLTCGSVDDGKSTLIGCLLYDTQHIYDDQLCSLYQDSRRHGTQGKSLDFALLVDGLQAEREQGITIDVAYRYFSTKNRKFIIADTPGHEQYTRNMVTGASTSSASILLIDARKGILEQTKRHTFISNLLGIKHLIVAVNKMDLVDYKMQVFEDICKDFSLFLKNIKFKLQVYFIPISALIGENIVFKSKNMLWYQGFTLLKILENINISKDNCNDALIFPVQLVNRPDLDFRGYSGTIASGEIRIGQNIKILPIGLTTSVSRIVTFEGDLKIAKKGQSITLVVNDNIDISRGDVIVDIDSKLKPIREADIDIVWMSEKPLYKKEFYLMKVAGKIVRIYIQEILHTRDINTFSKVNTTQLNINSIGRVKVIFDESIIIDNYLNNFVIGSVIFIDLLSNNTVAAGMIKNTFVFKKMNYSKNMKFFELELKDLIFRYFSD
ncbi:Sulfate adenylyltransferase subunit 1 [Buchnera aphidicola (Eriosoma grossulariae)]|uniref:sulfate adenylyltransferase subunit CysN n=1 Tax=Buchnera aphidicola TaxID=9 RepID=UPI003464798C